MDPSDDDNELDAIKQLWPQITAQQDQALAICREWVVNAPEGQIAGLWDTVKNNRDIRAMDDDAIQVIVKMAFVGLCASIESAITAED
jgi:hypothetical protein